MIAFDTNIAIYTLNNHPKFYNQSKDIINSAKEQGGCVSVLLISELLQFSGLRDDQRMRYAENFIESLFPISFISTDSDIARYAASILREYSWLKLPDAVHLTTAAIGGATEFWTNDHRLADVMLTTLKIKLLQPAAS